MYSVALDFTIDDTLFCHRLKTKNKIKDSNTRCVSQLCKSHIQLPIASGVMLVCN